MDARAWALARRVNAAVNVSIEPASDLDNYGVAEYWAYPDNGKGDCEDYALLKRRELMNLGFPREALLMTVVRDLEGEGHAVLMLKTTAGDFILDNKVMPIRRWSETGYHFVKRQSQENPNVWVSLLAPDVPMVASTGRK
jgi:predicted transglutaminase-like cysteine proteinase